MWGRSDPTGDCRSWRHPGHEGGSAPLRRGRGIGRSEGRTATPDGRGGCPRRAVRGPVHRPRRGPRRGAHPRGLGVVEGAPPRRGSRWDRGAGAGAGVEEARGGAVTGGARVGLQNPRMGRRRGGGGGREGGSRSGPSVATRVDRGGRVGGRPGVMGVRGRQGGVRGPDGVRHLDGRGRRNYRGGRRTRRSGPIGDAVRAVRREDGGEGVRHREAGRQAGGEVPGTEGGVRPPRRGRGGAAGGKRHLGRRSAEDG